MADGFYGKEIESMLKEWGWSNPPSSVIEAASLAVRLKELKTASALVELGLYTNEEVLDLLKTKPANVKTLEFAAVKKPKVRPAIDKILSLKSGIAYYEKADGLSIHPVMTNLAVQNKCKELEAVIVNVDSSVPAIVFTSLLKLTGYKQAGRVERSNDPIRHELLSASKLEPLLAVVSFGIFSSLSSDNLPSVDSIIELESTNLWIGDKAVEESHKTLVRILDDALSRNGTDIAFEPRSGGGAVCRMRKHGDLVPLIVQTLDADTYKSIWRFLAAKSGANDKGHRFILPIDGSFPYRGTQGEAILRISFIPLNHLGDEDTNPSISIRLFVKNEDAIHLENLRIHPDVQKVLKIAGCSNQGLILLCGGTNTGKSTTIAGVMNENVKFFGDTKKRISVEQPMERRLSGVVQVNVAENVLLDKEKVNAFELILRGIKRHDPDVIFAGEIRDKETGEMAVASAISGHLVFSTIHANTPLAAFEYLATVIDPDKRTLLVQSLSLLVGQSLAQLVCEQCGVTEEPRSIDVDFFNDYVNVNQIKNAKLPEKVRYINRLGCDHCGNTGVTGVIPINEVLRVTEKVKRSMFGLYRNEDTRDAINNERVISFFECGMEFVEQQLIELRGALI